MVDGTEDGEGTPVDGTGKGAVPPTTDSSPDQRPRSRRTQTAPPQGESAPVDGTRRGGWHQEGWKAPGGVDGTGGWRRFQESRYQRRAAHSKASSPQARNISH